MKHCKACDRDLPEEAFYLEPKRPGGLSGQCKECKRARMRRHWKESYYPAHREELIAAVLTRRKAQKPSP
jgi:hypothetical protein